MATLVLAPFAGSRHLIRQVFELRPPQDLVGEGFYFCNPSCAWHDGSLWISARAVHYRLGVVEKGPFWTKNVVGRVDNVEDLVSGRLKGPALLEEPFVGRRHLTFTRGLEDLRLFSYAGGLWASAAYCEANDKSVPEQVIAQLSVEEGRARAVRVTVQQSPKPEKNWAPWVSGGRLFFVYSLRPRTVILEHDWATKRCRVETMSHFSVPGEHCFPDPMLSGGTQWVDYSKDEVLSVVHERIDRVYQHRLATLDRGSMRVARLSQPFFFLGPGIEFCCGLAELPDGSFLATFGQEDARPFGAILEKTAIESMLAGSP